MKFIKVPKKYKSGNIGTVYDFIFWIKTRDMFWSELKANRRSNKFNDKFKDIYYICG
jgi:hypothetical protein